MEAEAEAVPQVCKLDRMAGREAEAVDRIADQLLAVQLLRQGKEMMAEHAPQLIPVAVAVGLVRLVVIVRLELVATVAQALHHL